MKDVIELKDKETNKIEYYESNDYDLENGRIDFYYYDASRYDVKVSHSTEEQEEIENPIDN